MKTVGTLHGGKAKIGKTRRYRQHRQQHHALPALALQMFIFLYIPIFSFFLSVYFPFSCPLPVLPEH